MRIVSYRVTGDVTRSLPRIAWCGAYVSVRAFGRVWIFAFGGGR